MPYSAYAVRYDLPAMLTETESLIATSAQAGIPDVLLAPLRDLITEGYMLTINPDATEQHWEGFFSRLKGALVAFEYEVVLPLAEVADVAAIA